MHWLLLILMPQLIGMAFGIFMIVGAVKMMQLRSHGLASAASVLALLPCSPAWLIGLPMGIWSLVVLSRREVKAAFEANQSRPRRPASPETGKLMIQGPADGLILAGCAALLTAIGVGHWLWLKWQEPFLSELAKNNLVGMTIADAVYGFVMIVAGVLMRRLWARVFVLVSVVLAGLFFAAVAALNIVMEFKNIPQWPVVIPLWLGVPIAIWASAVLFREDVRAAFQARKRSGDTFGAASATQGNEAK